jgi:DNA-cytosine methyltransferase
MTKIKVLDIFAGIGGFSHALDKVTREGETVFETVAFCEWDKDCQRVLARHWPNTPIYGDVNHLKYVDGSLLYTPMSLSSTKGIETKIDMIVGGFPCTDISTAGLQKGLIDEEGNRTRSGLWFEYKRLIGEIRPRWVLIENVRNLVNNGLLTVLQDLDELGYDCEWQIISARDVGACHLRERIWITAWPRNAQSVELKKSMLGDSNEITKKRKNDKWSNFCVRECRSLSTEELRERTPSYTHRGPVWDKSGRILRENRKGSRELGNYGEERNASTPNSDFDGCEEGVSHEPAHRGEGPESDGSGPGGTSELADSNYFRFFPAFASEEAKSKWWAEATSKFRHWWKTQSDLRGVYDGPTTGLHEKFRRARIKQLGNGIVPAIAELHGERIAYHEYGF